MEGGLDQTYLFCAAGLGWIALNRWLKFDRWMWMWIWMGILFAKNDTAFFSISRVLNFAVTASQHYPWATSSTLSRVLLRETDLIVLYAGHSGRSVLRGQFLLSLLWHFSGGLPFELF